MIESIKKHFQKLRISPPVEKKAEEAYDLWSATYDQQPGNLMLDLDAKLFSKLIENISFQGKIVADIGCGTGRHWPEILSRKPAQLQGYDVSAGMLRKLTQKFPDAIAIQITDDLLTDLPDACCDILISTLTMAHLVNAEEALKAWCRVLKEDSDLIITDFHPDTLARGGKRTFRHNDQSFAVQNYIHSTSSIKKILLNEGFTLASEEQRCIDSSVKHYYQDKKAIRVYEEFIGMPIIYGLHLQRRDGVK